jgi:hypothetical protein
MSRLSLKGCAFVKVAAAEGKQTYDPNNPNGRA